MTIKPWPIPSNGKFAIVAPSSRGTPDAAGIAILEARGYEVMVHAQNDAQLHQSAGAADVRAAAINAVFNDPDIDAVMAARGGNRVMHALPFLDFKLIGANPKPLIGFSDGTALLNAIYAQCGLIGFHGPTLSRLSKAQAHELDQMFDAMNGQPQTLRWDNARALRGGTASGPLIGGNLSMMAALAGTPYMPDARGAILFLEDVGDQLSRYDRMLAQLRLSGVLGALAGIVFGQVVAEGDSSVTPFGFSLEDIVAEHVAGLDIPVLVNAPFGHTGPLCTLPVGGTAVLDADAKTLALA